MPIECHELNIFEKWVRLLIVDDLAFVRLMISRQISTDSVIEITGVARDDVDALAPEPMVNAVGSGYSKPGTCFYLKSAAALSARH
jgi:hypothetical protein